MGPRPWAQVRSNDFLSGVVREAWRGIWGAERYVYSIRRSLLLGYVYRLSVACFSVAILDQVVACLRIRLRTPFLWHGARLLVVLLLE